jgi:hypothetical protein
MYFVLVGDEMMPMEAGLAAFFIMGLVDSPVAPQEQCRMRTLAATNLLTPNLASSHTLLARSLLNAAYDWIGSLELGRALPEAFRVV